MKNTYTWASLSETRKSPRCCFVLRLGETELRALLSGIAVKRTLIDPTNNTTVNMLPVVFFGFSTC